MRKFTVTLLAFFLIFGGYLSAEQAKSVAKAKDFTLLNLKGEKVSLKDFQGKKVVLLNFFATWCPSCREEMPTLNKLYPEYKEKNVEFIGIDLREDTKKVSAFVEKQKIGYPVLLDTKGEAGKLYRVEYIPVNVIVDQNGVIRFIGSFIEEKDLRKELDKIVPLKKEKLQKSGGKQ